MIFAVDCGPIPLPSGEEVVICADAPKSKLGAISVPFHVHEIDGAWTIHGVLRLTEWLGEGPSYREKAKARFSH